MTQEKTADVSYAEIGLLFRVAREEQLVGIEQAARELHIRAHYLRAIEQGRFSELPGVSYTKGYLQTYAHYLRLDKDEIIRRFEQMEGVLARKGFYFPEVFSREQKPSHHLTYASLAIAAVVFVLWVAVFSPQKQAISVIDTVEYPPQTEAPNTPLPLDAACFHAQDSLYPPCYKNTAANVNMVLPRRHIRSVMELAN